MSKILTFFSKVFDRKLDIIAKASTKYVQKKIRKNIVANKVVTCNQADLAW